MAGASAAELSTMALPGYAIKLLETGRVQIVGEDSSEMPAGLAEEIRAKKKQGFWGFNSTGQAVCHLLADQNVLIVLIGNDHPWHVLHHEMIHAAQVWCALEAQKEAFISAATDGSRIVQSVEKLAGPPDSSGEYRDLDWCSKACEAQMPNSERLHEAFGLALSIYPRAPTARVANSLGITNECAIVASVHAHYMLRAGFCDWKSDVAREIVAHRFEAESHPVITQLFVSALEELGVADQDSDRSQNHDHFPSRV